MKNNSNTVVKKVTFNGTDSFKVYVNKDFRKNHISKEQFDGLFNSFGQKNLHDIWVNFNKPVKFHVVTTFSLPECGWEEMDILEIFITRHEINGKDIIRFNCEKHKGLNGQLPVFIPYQKIQLEDRKPSLVVIEGGQKDELDVIRQRLKKCRLK